MSEQPQTTSCAQSCAHPAFEADPARVLGAVGETALQILTSPQRCFRSFRWQGGFLRPMLFAVLLSGPSAGLGYVALVALERGRVAGEVSGWVFLALVLAAPPVYFFLRAHLVHLAVVLQGVVKRPFEATFRAVAYSNSAVAPVLLLPVVGTLAFLVWGAMVEITALRSAHDLSLKRAALSVLMPIVAMAAAVLAGLVPALLFKEQIG